MATGTKRDVRLAVGIETTGQESIRRLADEITRLSAQGGDAAPAFAKLDAEISKIGAQAEAVATLKALSAEVQQLAATQQAAADASAKISERYAEQKAKADALRASQASVREEIRQGEVELTKAQSAVKELAAGYDAAGKRTATYRSQLTELTADVGLAKLQLTEKRNELDRLAPVVAAAAREEKKLGDQFQALSTSAQNGAAALKDRNAAFAAAQAAAQAAGVTTTDLVAAEDLLLAAYQRVAAATEELKLERVASAAAAKELAALDAANTAALERQQKSLFDIVAAYEREQQAMRESAAAAERLAAAQREQAESDRLALIQSRALSDQLERGKQALQAEAATIREAAQFVEQYTTGKQRAAQEALDFVLALEREEAAATKAALRIAELNATAERTAAAEKYVNDLAAAFDAVDAQAAQAAAAIKELDQQADIAQAQLRDRLAANAAAYERDAAALNESVAATQRAEQEALDYVLALERESAASDKAARSAAELDAQIKRTADNKRYVDEVAAAFDRAEQEARQAAKAVADLQGFYARLKTEASGVDAAFGQTGVRSLEAIRAEIFNVNNALSTLKDKFAIGAIGADDLARATSSAQVRLQTLTRELETIPTVAGPFERISGSINNLITRFGALGAAIGTIGIVARPIIETEVALEQMRRVLTTVTGSTTEAAKQIEFLRSTAQFAGQSFTGLGESYSKFAASALQVGLSTATVQKTFASVATAAGNLGLSSDQAKRALEAMSQMASKGVISMEELRQQLGDALPGALPLFAQQLGLSTQELNKLTESGQLLAVEGIPALAEALLKLAPPGGSPVEGLVAEWNRFKNVVSETTSLFAAGAFGDIVGGALSFVGNRLKEIAFLAGVMSEGITLALRSLGVAAAAVAGGDLKILKDGFAELTQQSQDRLDGLASRITGVGDAAAGAGKQATALASQVGAAIGKLEAATPSIERHAQAHSQAGTAAIQHAQAQGTVAAATKTTTGAIEGQYKSLSQLLIANVKAVSTAESLASSSQKVAEAKKDEAERINRVAQLSGLEADAKAASARAAEVLAVGLDAQAAADQRVVAAIQNSIASTQQYAAANGLSAEAISGTIDKLDKLLLSKQADAEKSLAAAEAARAEADQRRLAAEVLKDNTSRYVEFKAAVEQAELALTSTQRAFERDKATAADVTAATIELTKAKRLLSDAITDTAAAAERNIAVMRADADISRASLQVRLEEAKRAVEAAQLLGNETSVRQALIAQKQIELQIAAATVEAKRAEANEIIRTTALLLDELAASGQLTPEKEFELQLRIKNAQAKVLEADATTVANTRMSEEIRLLKETTGAIREKTAATNANTAANRTNASSGGGGGGGLDINGLDSQGRNADGLKPGDAASASGSFDEYNKRDTSSTSSPTDKQGFVLDSNGQRQTSGTFLPAPSIDGPWSWVGVLNQGYTYGGYWVNERGVRYTGMKTAPFGQNKSSFLGEPMSNLGTAGYEKGQNGPVPYQGESFLPGVQSPTNPSGQTTELPPSSGAAPAATGGGGGSYTVNVTIAGRTSTVKVASRADADALQSLLQQLEDSAGAG
jgi:tape measure domain-containing protein